MPRAALLSIGPQPRPVPRHLDRAHAVAPWRAPVNLVNFLGRADGSEAVTGSWTIEQNDRLDAVRDRHDPGRLFRFARHS